MTLAAMLRQWLQILGFQGAAFIVAAATVTLAAKAMPPAMYGEYSLLLSITQVIGGIALSWLNQTILRFAREHFNQGGSVWTVAGTALVAEAAIAILLAVALMLCAWLFHGRFTFALAHWPLLALALLTMTLSEAASYTGQAANRFTGYGLGQFLAKLGPLACMLGFLSLLPASADGLLLGTALGWALATAVTVSRLPVRGAAPLFDAMLLRRMLSYGWRLPFGSTAGILATWMGLWFVQLMIDTVHAGLYGWASSVYALIGGILIPFSAVLAPRLTDMHLSRSRDEIYRVLRLALAVALLATALLPLGLLLLRGLTHSPLWPTAYTGAGAPLTVLLATLPAQLLITLLNPLIMANETMIGRAVLFNIVAALVNAAGNLLLIPWLGIEGAALATVLSVWTLCALAFTNFYNKLTPEPDHSGIRGMAFAGCVSIAASLLLAFGNIFIAIAATLAATPTLLLMARRLGWLCGIDMLQGHLPRLPGFIHRPARAVIEWCVVLPRTRET
ncbi:lipopolysaccharide biosynthesis protein [Ferrovibrio sp.]|uniref:lipopolysaccharide biosynthesis protein n=1 Tax=Ferrovibrio sp. TaxID=1917215 RepID=UPI003D0E22E4